MKAKDFDKLTKKDFENGAVLDEIYNALKLAENRPSSLTPFYCEECEYTTYPVVDMTTEGFDVECDECQAVWHFTVMG